MKTVLRLFFASTLLVFLTSSIGSAQTSPYSSLSSPLIENSAENEGYYTQKWNSKLGLPINALSSIIKDSQGYLWFTTFDGLVRFDGTKIKLFNSAHYDVIKNNRFISLLEDGDGNVYANSEIRTTYIVDKESGNVSVLKDGANDAFVYYMSRALDGHIIFATKNGIYRSNGTANLEPVLPDEDSQNVFIAYQDQWENYWFVNDFQQLIRYKNGSYERIPLEEPNTLRYSDFLTRDNHGFITWKNQIVEFTQNSYQIHSLDEISIHNSIISIHPSTKSNELFIGTNNDGYQRWNNETGQIRPLDLPGIPLFRQNSRNALVTDNILATTKGLYNVKDGSAIFESSIHSIAGVTAINEHEFWIATDGDGLVHIKKSPFKNFVPGSLSNVYAIAPNKKGNIFVGTFGAGAYLLKNGVFSKISLHNDIEDKYITSIATLNDGRTVFGANSRYLYVYSPKGETSKEKLPIDENQLLSALYEDFDNQLWMGGSRALYIQKSNSSFTNADILTLRGVPQIRHITQTPDSTMWISTQGMGLITMKNRVPDYVYQRLGLSDIVTRAIVYDPYLSNSVSDFYVWVTTESHGLHLIHSENNELSVREIKADQGLIENTIHTVVFEGEKALWLSSNQGLSRISRDNLTSFLAGTSQVLHSRVFKDRDGLPDNEFNGGVQQTGFAAADGNLYFSNQKGLVSVNPAALIPPSPNSTVVIQDVYANDVPIYGNDLNMEVSPGEYNLKIYFTIAQSLESRVAPIWYSIGEPKTATWYATDPEKPLVFAQIEHGNHRVNFSASYPINDSSDVTSLVVSVRPYWYQSVFAFVLYLIIAISIIAGMVAWRVRYIRNRNRYLEELVTQRSEELQQEQTKNLTASQHLVSELRTRNQIIKNIHEVLRQPSELLHNSLSLWSKNQDVQLSANAKSSLDELIVQSKTISEKLERSIDTVSSLEGEIKLSPEEINLNDLLHSIADSIKNKSITFQARTTFTFADVNQYVIIDGFVVQIAISDLIALMLSSSVDAKTHLALRADHNRIAVILTFSNPNTEHKDVLSRTVETDELDHSEKDWALELTGILRRLKRNKFTIRYNEIDSSHIEVTLETELSKTAPIKEFADSEPVPDVNDSQKTRVAIFDSRTDYSSIIDENLLPECDISVMSRNRIKQYADIIDRSELVLLDSNFTYANPFKLIEEARERAITNNTTIVMTAQTFTSDEQNEALRAGADMYITKALSNEATVAQIRSFISLRRRLNSTFASHNNKLVVTTDGVNRSDKEFAKRVLETIQNNLSDPNFNIEALSKVMKYNRSSLSKRIKKTTQSSPSDILREVRIIKAMELLNSGSSNISEVAFGCGFSSLSYFSQAFKAHTGKSPSDWVEEKLLSEA